MRIGMRLGSLLEKAAKAQAAQPTAIRLSGLRLWQELAHWDKACGAHLVLAA